MNNDSLQSFDDSQYERPNQPWDCGHACEGLRCPLGPTTRGECQADYECAPLDKNGKWVCSRSKRLGGRCDEGPSGHVCSRPITQCSPVASIRRKRGTFVVWCCTATLGLTLLTLGASWRDKVMKPGNLSTQHAQILKNTNDNQRCAACHEAAELGGLDEWTQLAIAGDSDHPSQSQRCLVCHQDKIGGEEISMFPHGISEDVMQARTLDRAKRMGLDAPRETNLVGMHDGKVACAACHREHQGALHDLTAMSNAQCAECHQDNYRSFANGHPEFGSWPYERRTQIAFDHAMHQGRYFPESKTEFACRSCHVSKQDGSLVSVVNYETACQSCHEPKIQQSYGDGVPLISLPMLDLRAFKAEGLSIGEWPEMANGDFDGPLPPLMRVLLSADAHARASMEQFESNFEFADVDPGNLDDLEAAVDIAWGIKRLVHDLTNGGPPAIRKRLEQSLDVSLTDEELRELLGQLPRDTAVEMQQTWFPSLPQELASVEAGQSLPAVDKGIAVASGTPSEDSKELATWHRDDETFQFYFRPRGHSSRFMTAWLGALSSSPRQLGSEAIKVATKQLTSQTSAGLCATCHSVDTLTDGLQIHWRGKETFASRDAARASDRFTHFSHGPHLILPQLSDCTTCHQVNTDVTTSGDYLHTDPYNFQPGFHPMEKQDCANCHAPKLAGDQCTTCHQYHVGTGSLGEGGASSHP